jgi:hypothetical protein
MRPPVSTVLAAIAVGSLAATAGCAAVSTGRDAAPAAVGSKGMPTGGSVDYQLGGAYDPPAGVGIVARDSTAEPAPGVWSICYVNGFQTQPGELERWTAANGDLLLKGMGGRLVTDPGWPDEVLLDTSDASRVERISDILGVDIDRCAAHGFDAVEIDNLDSFTRSGGRLDLDGALALARAFADRVHARGMLIGQKNAAEQTRTIRDSVGFDFAVAEECVAFAECDAYADVYGDRVIDIEYPESGGMSAAEICSAQGRPLRLVIRDRDLVAAGSPGYRREVC